VPRLYFAPGEPLNRYLSRNTRSAVAKARNRIDGAGLERQLAWTSNEAEIDKVLPEIYDVCWRRNQQLGRGSGVAKSDELALFTDIVHTNARAGRARLLTHRFNASLAAYALCFQTAGNLWVFSNSVSPDWLDYSAGTITNAEVVKRAHEDPTITCVDWGGGSQRYKLSGEVKLAQLQNLEAWSSRAARLGLQGFQIGKRKLQHVLAERSANR
jgi:CelD/BcsL family acetyltransferase involved in cellulose biosynthesis